MSRDKPKQVLTIDHANKQRESSDVLLYRHWLRQARLLRETHAAEDSGRFRRDQVERKRS